MNILVARPVAGRRSSEKKNKTNIKALREERESMTSSIYVSYRLRGRRQNQATYPFSHETSQSPVDSFHAYEPLICTSSSPTRRRDRKTRMQTVNQYRLFRIICDGGGQRQGHYTAK